MANVHKGEVEFTVEGKTYKLVMNHNAFCEVESALGRPYPDVAMEMQNWGPPLGPDNKPVIETEEQVLERSRKMRFATVRAVFWAGLQEHHSNITLRAAGNLMDATGGARAGLGLICQSLVASLPDAEEAAVAENPPKPGESSAVESTGSAS